MTRPIDAVVVALPARNEDSTVEACLLSIDAAAARLRSTMPVIVTLAADSCSDQTVDMAQRLSAQLTAHLQVVQGQWRSAGIARAAATTAGLDALHWSGSPAAVWIAGTDADTTVPLDWLTIQLRHADRGADLVLGTVALPESAPASLRQRFHQTYHRGRGEDHPHVHGANFGIRRSGYEALGGWPPTSVGEDHALLAAAIGAGLRVVRSRELEVVTSARLSSRVSGGFADDLAALTR